MWGCHEHRVVLVEVVVVLVAVIIVIIITITLMLSQIVLVKILAKSIIRDSYSYYDSHNVYHTFTKHYGFHAVKQTLP